MKYLAYIISASLLIFSSACSPGGSAAKGIKGIIKRSDCKGPCHKTMGCEGKALTLEMELANNNIMTSGNTIFARDPDNYDYTVKIEFGESVPVELYGDIKNPVNKRFIVTGIVEGYDQYVHEQCTRSYILKVNNPKDFKVYDK
ncbi:MAG: hypothetical protein JNL65_05890 [Saprospiraceae bacterium]|nr:hypothetical protein [Saprospiraceae bacterium]HRG67870.1 hypothetical protein [Saprospiraceae bacterium]